MRYILVFIRLVKYLIFKELNLCPDIVTFSKSFSGSRASISGYGIKKTYNNLWFFINYVTYFWLRRRTVTAMEAIKLSMTIMKNLSILV